MRDETRPLTTLGGTWVVMRRELRALLQDRRSVTMMVIFGLVLPILIASGAMASKGNSKIVLEILTEVLVFPYIAGLQAALTAFVGEREHGTLGPLLATPLANISIFGGKLLGSAFIPSFVTSVIGFLAFIVRLRGKPSDPFTVVSHGTLFEMIALSLVAGFAMVALGLLFGSKAKSVRGAQAITAVVVFPVIVGVQLLALVVVSFSAAVAWSVLVGFVILIILGLGLASRVWNREEALVSAG